MKGCLKYCLTVLGVVAVITWTCIGLSYKSTSGVLSKCLLFSLSALVIILLCFMGRPKRKARTVPDHFVCNPVIPYDMEVKVAGNIMQFTGGETLNNKKVQYFYECFKTQWPQLIRISKDCIELIQSTCAPDVFFMRYDLLVEVLNELKFYEMLFLPNDNSMDDAVREAVQARTSETNNFLVRSHDDMLTKADELKTEKGRRNRKIAYFKLLMPFIADEPSETLVLVNGLMQQDAITVSDIRMSIPNESSNSQPAAPADYITDQNGSIISRADGDAFTEEDIEYLRATDYERVSERYKNSPNPKFHRSREEEQKKYTFATNNAEYIDTLEQAISLPDLYSFDSIDAAIDHTQRALIATQELAEYCSKIEAGRLYFEDRWLHSYNSQNPDFSFIDRIKERYSDLTHNYETRKHDFEIHKKRQNFLKTADDEVYKIILNNPGILQKDVHKHFDADLKPTIGTAISHLIKDGRLDRTKQSNSFALHVK